MGNLKVYHIKKRGFLFIWFVLYSFILQAQFYESGQDPASIRWKQIRTTNFQIIFPQEFEKEANRLANTLTYISDYVSKSLNHKPRKISIIIHGQSAYSNGFVAWAPKRMELYPTPSQDSYAQDWLDQLAVHELRHVVQIDKLNQGFTRILSIIFGQQAVGLISGLIPRWFFEGDAVTTETSLTSTGRGRDASFEMEMKTLVTSNPKLFSYPKALLGSYKDYIPDHYNLGYPIVAWSRTKFGPTIYDNNLNFVGRNPYMLFPFPLRLKKQTGLMNRQLYNATYLDLNQQWNKQISAIPETDVTQWNTRRTKYHTSYRFPQYIDDTTLLVVKSGIDQLTQFVLLYKSGKETIIHTPGNYYGEKFSYAAGNFVWSEEIPDIRWDNRSFFCIKIGNITKGRVKMLTNHTRYFAPALSPDGTKIAAIEVTVKNEYFLVILDSRSGNLIDRITSPGNKFLQLPEWLANGNEIAIVTTDKKGKSLKLFHIISKNWQTIVPPTYRNISLSSDAGEYVIFVSEFNGTNNLYALKKADKTIWQVTNSKYGAFDPNIKSNNTIIFSQYSSHGFNVVSSKFVPQTWIPVDDVNKSINASGKLYEASEQQENFNFQDSIIPTREYQVTHYSKLTHIFNIHSWAPFYYNYQNLNLDYISITPGFTVLSQDKLSTCNSFLGFSYDQDHSHWITGITYKGLYPLINFSLNYGGTAIVHQDENLIPPTTNQQIVASTMIHLPLDFTRGCFIKGITPAIEWEYKNEWFYAPLDLEYKQGMSYINYSINAYWHLRKSFRDLSPKWGTDITARYNSTPFENTQLKAIWYVKSRFYFPGIFNHHSLQLALVYQEQEPLRYLYSSLISFPRGYTSRTTYQLKILSIDYAFPIVYPDFHIGPIIYVKRLRGNLFCDVANNKYQFKKIWFSEDLSSIGADLTCDFHLLRIIFPINAGVRMIYFPQTGSYTSSLLFRIDLTNF